MLAGLAVALVVVAAGQFRWGTGLFAFSVVVAAMLRAVLPERTAGALVVRSRALDVLTLSLFALGLTVLAAVVPPPR